MKDSFYSQIEGIVSRSGTNNIFIVGKGSTIDELDLTDLSRHGIIINLNDSERIVPGDFCIFHQHWVIESLKETGFQAKLYLSDQQLPPNVNAVNTRYVATSQESSELASFRFSSQEFILEDVLLVSALKLSRMISEVKQTKQTVYLLGFDFEVSDKSYSKKIETDFSEDEFVLKKARIAAQEQYLNQFIHLFENSPSIQLMHVGFKTYSKMLPTQFNKNFFSDAKNLHRAGAIEIKAVQPEPQKKAEIPDRVLIIAELTNNHLGDLGRLREMIQLSKEAGADLIKVQKRDVDTFYTKEQLGSFYHSAFGSTLGEYRRGVELTTAGFELLISECEKNNIGWFSSILDYNSFKFLNQFQPPLIKLPSTISNHKNFHASVAREYKGGVVISTGYTDASYEKYVLETFVNNDKIYLLQCTSAYPTPPQDCHVSVVRHYHDLSRKFPKIVPGYSSHDLGSLGCMLAVAAGAKMVEKHVKLGNVDWVHFDEVALDLTKDDFKSFCKDIRTTELMCGTETKTIKSSEHHKYSTNEVSN